MVAPTLFLQKPTSLRNRLIGNRIKPSGPTPPSAIKVLNLLSNRYHAGVVRGSSNGSLALELPLTSHLHAGQRVRFVLADEAGKAVVTRQSMHGALVTRVNPNSSGSSLDVELATA